MSQKFLASSGRQGGHPCKIILSSSLISMQNLVTVSHTVCPHVSQKCWGLLGGGVADPLETRSFSMPSLVVLGQTVRAQLQDPL